MANFNYPIKVIKKKFDQSNYKPFAVDCSTGNTIALENSNKEKYVKFSLKIIVLLTAIALLYFIVLQPLIQTSSARLDVSQKLESLSSQDYNVLKQLEFNNQVISETIDQGQITLHLEVEKSRLQQTLELAFSMNSVREVYTDGKTVAITFVSSET